MRASETSSVTPSRMWFDLQDRFSDFPLAYSPTVLLSIHEVYSANPTSEASLDDC